MLIRKLFKFENAHIVRNCTSDRCKRSIHGHSYKVELLLKASKLDHGQMVYDFGLLKGVIKELFDSFDHAICYWQKDDPEYIQACKTFSARWVALPVSPSAEQFSRIFFYLAQQVLASTTTQNGEGDVEVYSVIVHETDTGYAQSFLEDIENEQMGLLSLDQIIFSEQVQVEWSDPQMYENLKNGIKFQNPNVKSKVNITCPRHGIFKQLAKSHLEGAGCLKCRNESYLMGADEFIRRSVIVHGDRYNYDGVKYIDNHTKVDIVCPIHGMFSQQPRTHLKGRGCPYCSKWVSNGELEFLSCIGIPMSPNNRQVRIGKYFVDGLLDTTVYEFLGDYWHGNLNIYDSNDVNRNVNQTFGELHRKTVNKFDYLIQHNFAVKFIWECDWNKWKKARNTELPIIDYQSKNPLLNRSDFST
jgi:6-pyruvoyltetrahydropterin/6-carboxytetrahydropterin synthase